MKSAQRLLIFSVQDPKEIVERFDNQSRLSAAPTGSPSNLSKSKSALRQPLPYSSIPPTSVVDYESQLFHLPDKGKLGSKRLTNLTDIKPQSQLPSIFAREESEGAYTPSRQLLNQDSEGPSNFLNNAAIQRLGLR